MSNLSRLFASCFPVLGIQENSPVVCHDKSSWLQSVLLGLSKKIVNIFPEAFSIWSALSFSLFFALIACSVLEVKSQVLGLSSIWNDVAKDKSGNFNWNISSGAASYVVTLGNFYNGGCQTKHSFLPRKIEERFNWLFRKVELSQQWERQVFCWQVFCCFPSQGPFLAWQELKLSAVVVVVSRCYYPVTCFLHDLGCQCQTPSSSCCCRRKVQADRS